MKKFWSVLLVAVLLCSVLSGCASEEVECEIEYAETTLQIDYSKYEGVELSVYNWGYYISDGSEGSIDVNEEFERLTGIRIVYDNYDSNESLYAKLAGGGADYDVIIPSDYMVGRLISEGLLAELNFDNIPNYKYVSDKYKNTAYDPDNKYSVPYNVGMVGVIYKGVAKIDLYEEIQRLMAELTASIKKLRANGEKLAEAERDYKITLRQEALRLRAGDMPVTLINQVIYGVKEVAEKRFKRDVEQANYDANKEHINVTKLKLRILEAQLAREWTSAGNGDL